MPPLNRGDLVKAVATKLGRPVIEVDEALGAFLDVVGLMLAAGDPIVIRDFGKFELRWRQPVTKQNPRTGQPMQIAGHHTVVFVPSPKLRGRINGG